MKVQRTVEVCDTCEDLKREVATFTVTKGDKTVTKVLCAQHSRPLEVLLGNAKPTGRPPAKKAAARKKSVAQINREKKK